MKSNMTKPINDLNETLRNHLFANIVYLWDASEVTRADCESILRRLAYLDKDDPRAGAEALLAALPRHMAADLARRLGETARARRRAEANTLTNTSLTEKV
jgi:hypothetical protein